MDVLSMDVATDRGEHRMGQVTAQNSIRAIFLLVLVLPAVSLHGKVYQCTDAHGRLSFQDRECGDEQQAREIDIEEMESKSNIVRVNGSRQGIQQSEGSNLVRNSGFEQNLDFWASTNDFQAFTHIDNDGAGLGGALAVRSVPPENPEKRRVYEVSLSQCVPLDRGRRYRFAASFRPMGEYKSPYANRVNLYWYQSDNCTTKGEFGEYLEPDAGKRGWQRIVSDNRLRSLNAQSALIKITQSRIAANNKEARWDDIELTPTEFDIEQEEVVHHEYTLPEGENYLKNPDFPSNLSGWRHSGDTKWTAAEGSSGAGAARVAIFSEKGGYGAHSFSQCVNLGANRLFAMGAKVKVDPGSNQEGGGIFRLVWHEGLNCEGQNQAGFEEDRVEHEQEGWQELVVEKIEAPRNAQSATIYFTRGVQDSGLFAYFIDDVYFKAISE
ncbi:MAG: DUF4124 domain-containing protein [Cellvibrionaceae bacterium]